MPLTHYTDRHLVRLLATETRRTDTTPYELTRTHVALGRFLAGELVEELEVEPCDIQHPQGVRPGWRVADERGVVLMPFLRAGLYVAEGLREVFRHAPVFHVKPTRGEGLPPDELAAFTALDARVAVIADAVVNTGASLEPVLRQLSGRVPHIVVVSLVSPAETADRLASAWSEVRFLFARISTNQYVGAGSTDTGNRLFGTTHRQEQA